MPKSIMVQKSKINVKHIKSVIKTKVIQIGESQFKFRQTSDNFVRDLFKGSKSTKKETQINKSFENSPKNNNSRYENFRNSKLSPWNPININE